MSLNVTDHAIVQYFRRYLGIDIDKVKQDIVERIAEFNGMAVEEIKTGRFPIGEGIQAVVKKDENGKAVVTLLFANHKAQHEYDYKVQGLPFTSEGE